MQVQEEVSLKAFNTFGLEVKTKYFVRVRTERELIEILQSNNQDQKLLILGGGSNVLLTEDLDYLVIKNEISGIEILEETAESIDVKIGSGVNWHDLVLWAVEKGYGGIENLSLIPGTVGAAPIQNIGAYGVELKDVFISLDAINIRDFSERTFYNEECQFGYRDSIFKRELKSTYCIVSVTIRLSKNPVFKTSYGLLQQTLDNFGVKQDELSVKSVSDAVIFIRNTKLPNPKEIGNAGSFFKNPVISVEKLEELKKDYPEIPSYTISEKEVKVPAGWMIEKCDWKGYRAGNIGVHDKQALVLVNFGGGNGAQVRKLSEKVIESVNSRFGILLEREVNII